MAVAKAKGKAKAKAKASFLGEKAVEVMFFGFLNPGDPNTKTKKVGTGVFFWFFK